MPIHVRAEPGDYAPAVLLPGDPLRAQYIAEVSPLIESMGLSVPDPTAGRKYL